MSSLAKSVAGTLEYDALADAELACSRVLVAAAGQNPDRAAQLIEGSRKMERRSLFHRLRTRIYARDSSFFRRGITFASIFWRGGYLPDSAGMLLGPRAGLKDLLFGTPGTYRLINSLSRKH